MSNNKGFTLVEMMIVLMIIGIIGTVAYPAITRVVDTSNENDRAKHEYVVNKALNEYYALTGTYPNQDDDLTTVLPKETGVNLNTSKYNYTYTMNESNHEIIGIHVELKTKDSLW